MKLDFTEEQIKRYARHIILPEVGGVGQKKLLSSRVLVVGAGGLGSPAAYYLAAAGVGTIGIVDFDTVELSNLQRQILHSTSRLGMSKVESAKKTIEDLNPDVKVIIHQEMLTSENIFDVIDAYDIVVDGTDNFPVRYLLNDACYFRKKPLVHGSVFRFEGQATVFKPDDGPCYRCLYPEPPPPGMVPSCQEAGVLGVLPGVIGVIQATETIKLVLSTGRPLIGRLLIYNALDMEFRELQLRRHSQCPLCGENPTITELIDYEEFCQVRI